MAWNVWHLDDEKMAAAAASAENSASGTRSLGEFETWMDAKMGFGDLERQASAIRTLWAAGGYKKVAEVAVADVEEAWSLTNHVDRPWQDNEGVESAAPKARSSSVGDLFSDESGRFQVCRSIGFEPIEVEAPKSDARPARARKM